MKLEWYCNRVQTLALLILHIATSLLVQNCKVVISSLYIPLLHIVWIEDDLKKNLAKELAGPKVVNGDLNFLTKEIGIFEGKKGLILRLRRMRRKFGAQKSAASYIN